MPLSTIFQNGSLKSIKNRLKRHSVNQCHSLNDNTLLMLAVLTKRLDVAKFLLEKGVGINAQNKKGETALMLAAKKGFLDIAKFLIEKGANRNIQDLRGKTALDYAHRGRRQPFHRKQSIKCRVPLPDYQTRCDEKLKRWDLLLEKLFFSPLKFRPRDLRRALKKGRKSRVSHRTQLGDTALIRAAREGDYFSVKKLYEYRKNNVSTDGDTALMIAIRAGHLDIAKFLVEQEAFVDTKNLFNGKTAYDYAWDQIGELMERKDYGKPPSFQEEVRGQVNPKDDARKQIVNLLKEDTDSVGSHVLMKLSQRAVSTCPEVAHMLFMQGNVDAKNPNGETPLIVASQKGDVGLIKLLVQAKAKVNEQDKYGQSALIWAVRGNHFKAVRRLVQAGADINAEDLGKRTALIWAAREASFDVIKFLADAGADVLAEDKHGNTPSIVANYYYRGQKITNFLDGRSARAGVLDRKTFEDDINLPPEEKSQKNTGKNSPSPSSKTKRGRRYVNSGDKRNRRLAHRSAHESRRMREKRKPDLHMAF